MMSGIIIKLTLAKPDANSGQDVWVNMARVQEMYGPSDGAPYTELIMNIPDMAILVVESPERIMELLIQSEYGLIARGM